MIDIKLVGGFKEWCNKHTVVERFDNPYNLFDAFLHEQEKLINEQIERVEGKAEKYHNMLEDVVNELDLSDSMVEKHGPHGTPPAQLVREVLQRKDQEIKMLKCGMKEVKPSRCQGGGG